MMIAARTTLSCVSRRVSENAGQKTRCSLVHAAKCKGRVVVMESLFKLLALLNDCAIQQQQQRTFTFTDVDFSCLV